MKNLEKFSKNYCCCKKSLCVSYTITTTSIRKCRARFLKFPCKFERYYTDWIKVHAVTGYTHYKCILPKCLGQAELRCKHMMFHAFPAKTWGDKLSLDTPLKHHLRNILTMLWCCLGDADREAVHLLLKFQP